MVLFFTKPLLSDSKSPGISLPPSQLFNQASTYVDSTTNIFFNVQCSYSSPNHNTFLTRQRLWSPHWSPSSLTQPGDLQIPYKHPPLPVKSLSAWESSWASKGQKMIMSIHLIKTHNWFPISLGVKSKMVNPIYRTLHEIVCLYPRLMAVLHLSTLSPCFPRIPQMNLLLYISGLNTCML